MVESVPFSHSSLRAINGGAIVTNVGKPYLNTTDYIEQGYFDTSAWAFDRVTGEKWPQYNVAPVLNASSEETNLKTLTKAITKHDLSNVLDYRNPYAIYNSPVLHTATLTGLIPGTLYFYRVNGSCYTYNFTFPKRSYPFQVGEKEIYPLSLDHTIKYGVVKVLSRMWAGQARVLPQWPPLQR